MTRGLLAGLLFFAAFVSALQIVIQRHESRKLFVELQDLREQQDDLNQQWGQLLLEQATWGTHGRVEDIARQQLDMLVPPPAQITAVGW